MRSINICYLSKEPRDLAGLVNILKDKYSSVNISHAATIKEALAGSAPDLVIAHTLLSQGNIPILVVSSTPRNNNRRSDRLIEYVSEEELTTAVASRAISYLLEKAELVQELKELSLKDELTDLYNQRYLSDIVLKEEKKAERYHIPLTVIALGVDGMKQINGTHGHAVGDKLLAEMGMILKQVTREVDTVARLGGDEFVVVLPETVLADAMKVCGRIQHTVKGFAFANGRPSLNVSVCLGVASCSGLEHGADLTEAARQALLEAKKKGPGSMVDWGEISKQGGASPKEDQELIGKIKSRVCELASDAKKSHFQTLVSMLGDYPLYKKHLASHSERVSFYAERLAAKLGLSMEETQAIRRAGMLHDVGMLAMDEAIILKEGLLMQDEYALVKRHPQIGAQMLGDSFLLKNEVSYLLHHHEWVNGQGYPDHLHGTHIPIGARIIGIVEAWDAMITAQPYRPALSLDVALTELKKGAGRQFDPELTGVFTGMIEG